jgi:chemotaxis protein CheD
LKTLVVGVGDCKLTADPETVLVTYALGSCIAVALYDPETRVAGLLHFMLPESTIDAQGGVACPFRYADTGTPMLFREAYRMGADKKRLIVRLAGGAAVFDDGGVFNIGKRNNTAIRKILWKAGVRIHAEDVGGNCSRTVRLDTGTGKFLVQTPGAKDNELTAVRSPIRGGQLCLADC